MKRFERGMPVDTREVDPKRPTCRGSFLFAMALLILLGASAMGCFTLSYHVPPSDTPTAVVRPMYSGYVWFDVFHADKGCPGASKMIWNSEYLGTIEVRHPNQSFEIPANGYVRLVYRAGRITSGRSGVKLRAWVVIKPSPGSEYIIETLGYGAFIISGEEGDLVMVTCDDGVPVTVTPVGNGTDKEPPTP
jgi:hypothetical protein